VTASARWVAERAGGAPPALRERALDHFRRIPDDAPLPERLAGAARLALDAVLRQGQDRAAALDLLAADSLLTLALLAQAEESPAGLAPFARRLVGAASA